MLDRNRSRREAVHLVLDWLDARALARNIYPYDMTIYNIQVAPERAGGGVCERDTESGGRQTQRVRTRGRERAYA